MGEVIFQEGAHSDELYLIVQGEVDILMDPSVVSGHEHEKRPPVTIATLHPGQCFGEMALVDQGMRSATARAAQNHTRLLMIPKERLIALCEAQPLLGYRIMRNLAADLALKMRSTGFNLRQSLG
jgi:CRP-like cAMP-binding protein